MIRVLVSDPIHEEGIRMLENSGFEVVQKTDISTADLKKELGGYDAIVIRS
jgi:phosphoglycerate dehydrogenase-like enzyme